MLVHPKLQVTAWARKLMVVVFQHVSRLYFDCTLRIGPKEVIKTQLHLVPNVRFERVHLGLTWRQLNGTVKNCVFLPWNENLKWQSPMEMDFPSA